MTATHRALIIVDVQPTFCEGGALGVDGGNSVAEAIASYAGAHRDRYDLVLTTQDWHIDPAALVSASPAFVRTRPAQGVAGTAQAELDTSLTAVTADAAVKKGSYSAAYSGFEGVDAEGRSLGQSLTAPEITAVDVV